MRRFFDNKVAFGAIVFLFAIAFVWNAIKGFGRPATGTLNLEQDTITSAHGPTLPPDPWEGLVAHGPTLPPDPWEGLVAHGPTLPPDPWEGLVAA